MKRQKSIMRIAVLAFMTVMIVCLLSACSQKEETAGHTVMQNGKEYTIDYDAMTISDGTYVYHFQVNGRGNSSVHYEFVYPNGSKFYWTKQNNGGYGGWSDDYNEEAYVDGYTLLDVLDARTTKESRSKNVILIIVLFVIGLFNAMTPETAWYLSDGWKFKNSEPSEAALGLTRFAGIAAMVLAVIMLLV